MQYKILEGENFGEIAHSKNWQTIFWQIPKIESKLQSVSLFVSISHVISNVMYRGAQCRARV